MTNTVRPAVEVRALRKDFRSEAGVQTVLNGVDADFDPGTWTAIMGPSGSGKSTLLNCVAGLIRATSGQITVDGLDVTRASEKELTALRRGRVGFVFQAFNLVPGLTLDQNVALPSLFARRRVARGQVRAALAKVGITGRDRARPDELSGGQQQRAAIARALFIGPKVVLADEPTGALDVKTGRQVLGQFAGLVQSGAAVIMVTHDPAVAARADKVVFLLDGTLRGEMAGASVERIADEAATWEKVTA
ncbi:MAG: ABC transporter ATP-binding protein [Bifidobacteriaceae bacterium]|jgi:putative ABC transport system ATP-binding protein|nr:ABC transporter ATP-binding protein [Bifidobacteriaceae bacterium]